MSKLKVSLVISVYNEAEGIRSFWADLKENLDREETFDFEIIWVNDGSIDESKEKIIELSKEDRSQNRKHRLIEFSRNYGHEAAMIAGIDQAQGDAVICMDSDGQHPPQSIKEMVSAYQNGHDIILMNRLHREDNGRLKRMFSKSFYKLINKMTTFQFHENSTDFFLISREICDILRREYRERNRFIRGYIQSVGFSKKVLDFVAPAREYGVSNYSYMSLMKLAMNAIFSFSNRPLYLSIVVSISFVLFTLVFGLYSLFVYIFGDTPPSGYTSIILFLAISFSILFVIITILSVYFGKTIEEMRHRPIYIIKRLK